MPPKLHQVQSITAHDGQVKCISIGPRTGQIFVTTSNDRFFNLWSIGSNNPRQQIGPIQNPITTIHFNSGEDSLLCGNNSGAVLLYDLNENRWSHNWNVHLSSTTAVQYHSSDPNLYFSGGHDGKLYVLSSQQRRPLQVYSAHKGSINYIACSSNGRLVATCGDDKNIRIFDLSAQKALAKIEIHTDVVSSVQFHPTLPIIASSSFDRSVLFYNYEEKTQIEGDVSLDSSPVDLIRFAPDDVVLSCSSDYLKVIGWEPPELFDHFALGLDTIHDFVMIDRSITIASSSSDRVLIHRLNAATLKPFSLKNSQIAWIGRPEDAPESDKKTVRAIGSSKLSERSAKDPRIDSKKSGRSGAHNGLLDISAMPIKTPSQTKKKIEKAGNSISTQSSSSSVSEFRRGRSSFMSSMNAKYSRLININDLLDAGGLENALSAAENNVELGVEMLLILRMRPEVIQLNHTESIIKISTIVILKDVDLAIGVIESILQSFGHLVKSTISAQLEVRSNEFDTGAETRKKICDNFVLAFKGLIPELQRVAVGQTSCSSVAAELLEEWKCFA